MIPSLNHWRRSFCLLAVPEHCLRRHAYYANDLEMESGVLQILRHMVNAQNLNVAILDTVNGKVILV